MPDAPTRASGPRVIVIASDPLAGGVFRDRLLDADAEVVAVARSASEPGVANPGEFDAVVWDLGVRPASPSLPDELLAAAPVVLALVEDGEAAGEALASGAHAALGRARSGAAMVAAIRAAASGLRVVDPEIEPGGPTSRARGGDELTPREREVLALLVEGLTNREIAGRLKVSEHTAKFHVNQVLQKLGAQSRTEAVVKAARRGLITL